MMSIDMPSGHVSSRKRFLVCIEYQPIVTIVDDLILIAKEIGTYFNINGQFSYLLYTDITHYSEVTLYDSAISKNMTEPNIIKPLLSPLLRECLAWNSRNYFRSYAFEQRTQQHLEIFNREKQSSLQPGFNRQVQSGLSERLYLTPSGSNGPEFKYHIIVLYDIPVILKSVITATISDKVSCLDDQTEYDA
jgi:hypothetical protein